MKTNKDAGQELSNFEMRILIKAFFILKIPFIANAFLTGKDTNIFHKMLLKLSVTK